MIHAGFCLCVFYYMFGAKDVLFPMKTKISFA
uniref:Uncharacterized protein n=1 Tax=Rhizophora mucronata TaxID=61149 RepID=A0A2P2NQ06_RHIMU